MLYLQRKLLVDTAGAGMSIKVVMNEARIVRPARAADTVIIGNPEIVDATDRETRTIVPTGKGFGITNLIILVRKGIEVVHEKVSVARNTNKNARIIWAVLRTGEPYRATF